MDKKKDIMAKKEILRGIPMYDTILRGAKALNDVVSSTLGPNGRNVLYVEGQKVFTTNDGFRVVDNFVNMNLPDGEEYGANLIKEASIKTNQEAGDGTTSSILLSYHLLEEGIKAIKKGYNPILIKEGMFLALEGIKKELKKIDKECKTNDDIKRVATISANNDEEIGKMIADVYSKVGKEGIITHAKCLADKTYVDIKEGYNIDKRPFIDPMFINNQRENSCRYENGCYVLIAYYGISNLDEISSLLEKCIKEKKALLIVADEIDESVMKSFRLAKDMGKDLKVCAINLPSYAHYKLDYINDISYFIDGKNMETAGFLLGACDSFISTREDTLLVGGKGRVEDINNRIEDIKAQLDPTKTKFFNDITNERIGALKGKLACINIGGKSELEKRETQDRIDDALKAVKSAIAEGICPGGGYTLFNIGRKLKIKSNNPEIQYGSHLVIKVLDCQIRQNLINSGKFEDKWSNIKFFNHVWNAKNDKWEDPAKTNVIDSIKVLRCVCENSISVVSSILLSDSMLF
jgi:chaperonin GroEL